MAPLTLRTVVPSRLRGGLDSFGNLCGFNNTVHDALAPNLEDAPMLMAFADRAGRERTVCVARCPAETAPASMATHACLPGITVTTIEDLHAAIGRGLCAPGTFASRIVLGWQCVPMNGSEWFPDPVTGLPDWAHTVRALILARVGSGDMALRVFLAATAGSLRWVLAMAAVVFGVSLIWLTFLSAGTMAGVAAGMICATVAVVCAAGALWL